MSGVPSKKLPVYRHHTPSGQARVRWEGREIYLGKFDSPESRQRYAEWLTKIVTGATLDIDTPARRSRRKGTDCGGLSINELCVLFLKHAEQHYRKNGKLTSEYDCLKSALAPLTELFGMTAVDQFGPLALKAVREAMIELDWCRVTINKAVGRIRRLFRFGVENELADVAVLQKLEAVAPLLAGRTEAPDNAPRQPVPLENIALVKTKVSQRCADLIDLQLLVGARPGELLMLTGRMIDRSSEIWTAALRDHKTQHHGKARTLMFGPKAQLILRKYLVADPDVRLFPLWLASYRNAVTRACEQLDLPRWTPHWLRHNTTTRVRDEFGIEHAQAVAGHASPSMTARYTTKMDGLAVQVAKSIG